MRSILYFLWIWSSDFESDSTFSVSEKSSTNSVLINNNDHEHTSTNSPLLNSSASEVASDSDPGPEVWDSYSEDDSNGTEQLL